MYSRAHLLIEKEFDSLKAQKPWGIEAQPLKEENIFEWVAKIRGFKDTVWEGGVFRVYIKFDENYNIRPPQVCFHTVPFHPNIDMITGRPCIDFLDDYSKWQDGFNITTILMCVQECLRREVTYWLSRQMWLLLLWPSVTFVACPSLLSNPSLSEGAVNMEAVDMLKHSPHSYQHIIQECVATSQRMEAGLVNYTDVENKVIVEPSVQERRVSAQGITVPTQITKLSFDDYHMTWCGIATSKTKYDDKNPLLESMRNKPLLQRVHMGLPPEEIQDQVKKQMQEHSTLMYGRFGMRPTAEEEKAAKLNRLERMKKIYLPPRVSPTPAPDILLDSALPGLGTKDEPWEKEVEDLVAWTANLDAAAIDT